jgi:hypothetical protein
MKLAVKELLSLYADEKTLTDVVESLFKRVAKSPIALLNWVEIESYRLEKGTNFNGHLDCITCHNETHWGIPTNNKMQPCDADCRINKCFRLPCCSSIVCKKPINMYPEKCMVRSSVVNFK